MLAEVGARKAIVLELSWVGLLVDDPLDSWLRQIACVDQVPAWPTWLVAGIAVEVEPGCSDARRSTAVVLGCRA